MPAGPYNDARMAFIHKNMKIVSSGGSRSEVYDLEQDPRELRNLSNTPEAKALESTFSLAKARLREVKVTGQRK
jgi:hypothetical protein